MRASAIPKSWKAAEETVRGEVRFDDGLARSLRDRCLELSPGADRPGDSARRRGRGGDDRCMPRVGAPILARGGGTSLSGQCCNVAVILDFSKYLRYILVA